MATPQLNLSISAGANFSQSFNISNADSSVADLAGQNVIARMAKHPSAIDALASTSTTPVFDYIQFSTNIVNASIGQCVISLTAEETAQIQEGKYVYSVLLDDGQGTCVEILHGLVFVRPVIGFSTTLGV